MADSAPDWQCQGWEDHEIFLLETGLRMTFRARLEWLEQMHRLGGFLATKRPYLDRDGNLVYPPGWNQPDTLAAAEDPAP
jgi:hypothetical protein